MIARQIDRPIPKPSAFVVKYASKMCSRFAGFTAGPKSHTATSRLPDLVLTVRISRSRAPAVSPLPVLIVGYVYGLEGHSVDLQAFAPWRRFLDQRTGAANDVPSAHSVLDDTSEQPPDRFRICRLGEEQRRAASAFMTTALIGWLISAIDADSCARNATRLADANSV